VILPNAFNEQHGTRAQVLSGTTDLFEVLKKRRACRSFVSKEIPDEVLDRIVYAAHRAPTGGNIPYRFVIVVKDPLQLRMLKAAAPGYFGESTAAIVVCTDLRVDQGITKIDAEQCSLYDAGAAAENIVLAAYALGLGASFIKSYSETAVRTILRLPQGCRTELIVSLGYPAPDEPRPVKKRPEGKLTYYNTYGTLARSPGQKNRLGPGTPEQYLFEYALFLLTAAHGIINESRVYGAIRLLDAVSKLTGLYSTTQAIRPDPFLIEAKRKIDAELDTAMTSEEKFMKFIDDLVEEFAHELTKRYGRQAS
jgi:nitroreductase